MNNFIFENKTKVYFGKGGVKEYLGSLLVNYGKTVMLAYGGGSIKRNGVYDEIMGILNAAGKRVVEFDCIMSNPTYAKAQEGAKLARENHVDLILAVGGGSVSDCCKVISAQAKLDEDIWELENTKHTFPTEFIPLGTIVTVFGTGSEMNNGAVITHEEKKIKGALWGAQADFAFLDPSYTLTVPMKQVISGAFDTLSHAMEKENGITRSEIAEILTHAAFYAGWPKAWAAFRMAKDIWADEESADEKQRHQNSMIFPIGAPNDGFAQYFSGQSYLAPVSTEQVKIFNVTFEPGCRNNWHIHEADKGGGQILICVAGRGYYQEWGKEPQELHPGDVINIMPGVKHWHGAAPDSWFSHLAVEVPGENCRSQWCEPVSEEEYQKLK